MKQTALLTAFLGIITFGFIYLLGAFYSASFDISKWTYDARFAISLIGGFFSALVMIYKTYGGYDAE
jgi:hypothetical protein